MNGDSYLELVQHGFWLLFRTLATRRKTLWWMQSIAPCTALHQRTKVFPSKETFRERVLSKETKFV